MQFYWFMLITDKKEKFKRMNFTSGKNRSKMNDNHNLKKIFCGIFVSKL